MCDVFKSMIIYVTVSVCTFHMSVSGHSHTWTEAES